MTTYLIAQAVGGEEDDYDEVLEAGFSENADGSGFALMIQRTTYAPTEDDIGSGMDTYCLTTGSGLTHYGGLESISLTPEGVVMKLTAEAADVLRLDQDVVVRFDVDAGSRQLFVETLPQVVQWGRADAVPLLEGF